MMIVLADREHVYITMMVYQLRKLLHKNDIYACASESDIDQLAVQGINPEWLIIFNPADFPDLPHYIDTNFPELHCDFHFLHLGQSDSPGDINTRTNEVQPLYRLGPASQIAKQLHSQLEKYGNFTEQKDDTDVGRSYLHLVFSLDIANYRPEISHRRLTEFVRQGKRTIYLPLMPTFQMANISQPGKGPAISDLLLQLLGQNIQAEQLSQYWQPNTNGFLQFRPPDRSDDLVMCSTDILRSLVVLLRERISQEEEPAIALIDCAGIPLTTITSIAVLCDICEVCLPAQGNYAADAAHLEASRLLAQLPSSCKIKKTQIKTAVFV